MHFILSIVRIRLNYLATDVEGIFRLAGSAKRIKELEHIFDSPDRYGKGLDWTGYTVHDAANILRRYLNKLPQPIVPLEFYERFRDPLRSHQTQAVGDTEAARRDFGGLDHDKAITTYQQLITELPPLNRQLLLYILDLLAVFASKSDVNLMTSANLAAIFQPGMISHPDHVMSVQDYRLSQDVLIFLIDNQDSFLIGMSGTAADEKTVKEVQSGAQPRQQSTPKATQSGLGRSTSNASAGADSMKRFSGIRRNLSVSSKNSKNSSQAGPTTPSSGVFATGASGVHRSNTVPSKKSPALSSTRFPRGLDSPNTPVALSPALASPSARSASPAKKTLQVPEGQAGPSSPTSPPSIGQSTLSAPTEHGSGAAGQSKERLLPFDSSAVQGASGDDGLHLNPPPKVRKVSGLLSTLSSSGEKDGRQPNKLKKKRMPNNMQPSANSSAASLTGPEDSPSDPIFHTPLMTPGMGIQTQADPLAAASAAASQQLEHGPLNVPEPESAPGGSITAPKSPPRIEDTQQASESTLRPKTPTSVHSKSSVTDLSEQDHGDDGKPIRGEKKRRWRFSHSAKRNGQTAGLASQSPGRVGSNAIAERSTSSIGSWHRSRTSTSNDTAPNVPLEPVPSIPASHLTSTENGKSKEVDEHQEQKEEKKGFFGKMIAKVSHDRKDRKEREAEKDRAKSPPRDTDRSSSKQSLSAIANDMLSSRGKSMDVSRDPIPEKEPPQQPDLPTSKPSGS